MSWEEHTLLLLSKPVACALMFFALYAERGWGVLATALS